MSRLVSSLCLAGLLAACGVDGPPSPPPPREDPPERRGAITISGTASFGVAGGRTSVSRP
jgi:hypothetical protein